MANSDLPDVIHNHPVRYKPPTGHCHEDGDSVQFVDNGTVIYSHRNPAFISQVLTNHYSTISNYMAANKFAINPDKIHLLVMTPRRLGKKGRDHN